MFGDIVTAINGKSAIGMTSFDALEAIQSKPNIVTFALRSASTGKEREVVLNRKGSQTKNPVSYQMVDAKGTKVHQS